MGIGGRNPVLSPLRALTIRLVEITRGVLTEEIPLSELSVRLRALADFIDREQPAGEKAKVTAVELQKAAALEVYAYWLKATGRNAAAYKFTNERRSKVLARLKSGASVMDIKAAIDYVSTNDWHQGKNDNSQKYDDLITICANDTRVENYRNLSRNYDESPGAERSGGGSELATMGEAEQLNREAKTALKKGDFDGYDSVQRKLGELRVGGVS